MDETQANTTLIESPSSELSYEEQLSLAEAGDEGSPIIRTLTRLLVGGVLIGREELLSRLNRWEQESRTRHTTQEPAANRRTVVIDPDEAARTTLPITPPQGLQGSQSLPREPELKHVLMGLLFETESRMGKRRKRLFKTIGQTTDAIFSPFLEEMEENRLLEPVRSRFDRLVARGQAETRRWARRGQIEEAHSRRLATTAAQETFNSSMNELGQAPALQDLVRRQSAGLTKDALDEARVRTVSGDMLAEQLARRLLRRAPRHGCQNQPI